MAAALNVQPMVLVLELFIVPEVVILSSPKSTVPVSELMVAVFNQPVEEALANATVPVKVGLAKGDFKFICVWRAEVTPST